MTTIQTIKQLEKEFETLSAELYLDLEEQRKELIEMGECHGSCECETGYDVAETWQCKHCKSILLDKNKIKDFIKRHTRTLLESFGEEIIGEDEKEYLYPVGKDVSNFPLHNWESVTGNKLRRKQRLKVKEIINQIQK